MTAIAVAASLALTDAQARTLAKEGKSVIWIDGGLHATEVVGAHQLIETVYQLVSRTDDETTRILRDVIICDTPGQCPAPRSRRPIASAPVPSG